MEALIAVAVAAYGLVGVYMFTRLRKFYMLPREQRQKMTIAQQLLYFYGFYRVPRRDLPSAADDALSAFRDSWREMESIFQQLEDAFDRRRKEFEQAERSLMELQQEVQTEDERLRALSQLTPEAAQAVSEAITRTSRASIRQQVIISAAFFVLGVATTILVGILIIG